MKNFFNLLMMGIIGPFLLLIYTQGNTAHGQSNNESMVVKQEAKEIDINTWPETAQMAAKAMMETYGEPDGITSEMLVWYNTGPFKRTVVYKEEVDHDFPMPHKDVLEQFVEYEVPAEKFDELAMYDGSVIVERTKGEMSARCDKEAANYLALNLADDIVNGERTVEDAREFYADAIMEMLEGNKKDYLQELQFNQPVGDVGFSDETVMDMSKVKELKENKKQK